MKFDKATSDQDAVATGTVAYQSCPDKRGEATNSNVWESRVKEELRQGKKEAAETKKWFWSEAYVLVQRLKTFPGSSKRLIWKDWMNFRAEPMPP